MDKQHSFVVVLMQTLLLVGGDVSLCPPSCYCYHGYETVDCSHRAMTSLPPVTAQTRRLYVENNAIRSLDDDGALQNWQQLLVINLQHNDVTDVSTEAFCGSERLMEINLSHNKIKTFDVILSSNQSSRCQLTHLQILHLDFNQLQVIPANLSALAPNLHALYLGNNNIHSARLDASFADFAQLQTLDLRGNPLHTIDANDLEALMSVPLQTLNINSCNLTYIHPHALKYVSNLTSLFVTRNSRNYVNIQNTFHSKSKLIIALILSQY